MSPWLRARRSVALFAAVALAASCSLGDKQAQADRVIDAVRLTASAPRSGTVTARLVPRPVEAPAGFAVDDLALDVDLSQIRLPEAVAAFHIDNAGSRARLQPTGAAAFPVVLFDDQGIRLRQPDAAPDDARPWLTLDYEDLVEGSGELETVDPAAAYGVLAVLDPRLILDLAAGPLAGSSEVVATAIPGTFHYRANFDIPKALDDGRGPAYDDDRVEVVSTVLDLLRVNGDVHPGEVWTDARGQVERFLVRLHVRVERYVQLDLELDLRFEDSGPAEAPAEPGPDEMVLVDSLVPLRRSAGAAAPELASLLPEGLLGG